MSVNHEMERVGRIIAADQGLDVAVRGVSAFASAGHVTIPNIEHFEWLGRHARRMLHGLLDHECGHAVDTSFDALETWLKKKPCPALKTLANIVEDGYVERCQGERYCGSASNIRLMNEWFLEEKDDDGATFLDRVVGGTDLVSAVFGAINTVLTPHGHRDIEFFEKLSPKVGAMLRRVEPELLEAIAITDTKRTATNIALAERIFDKLKTPPEESGKGPCKGADLEGEKGEGEDEGEGGEGEDGGDGPLELERWSKPCPLSATDSINAHVRRGFDMPDHVQPYIVFSHEFDMTRDFSVEDQADQTAEFERAKSQAREAADAMIFAFEAALRATAMVAPVGGADEGEVDPELLTQYAVGSLPADQLYIQFDEGESDATAVMVLNDCSGSMMGEKTALCQQTAIAMHMALQACQLAHEICGFTTLEARHTSHPWRSGMEREIDDNFRRMQAALDAAEAQGVDVKRFARAVTNTGWHGASPDLLVPFHTIFKSWASNDARALMHISAIAQNLDGEAVLWAARRLAMRPERRKVMFVVSDGLPAGSRDNAQGHRYLEQAVERVHQSGMEIYGIGIMSECVHEFYPLAWVAHDLSDLISIAMGGLTEVLTQNRKERARVSL